MNDRALRSVTVMQDEKKKRVYNATDKLKEAGFWIYGAEASGNEIYHKMWYLNNLSFLFSNINISKTVIIPATIPHIMLDCTVNILNSLTPSLNVNIVQIITATKLIKFSANEIYKSFLLKISPSLFYGFNEF